MASFLFFTNWYAKHSSKFFEVQAGPQTNRGMTFLLKGDPNATYRSTLKYRIGSFKQTGGWKYRPFHKTLFTL